MAFAIGNPSFDDPMKTNGRWLMSFSIIWHRAKMKTGRKRGATCAGRPVANQRGRCLWFSECETTERATWAAVLSVPYAVGDQVNCTGPTQTPHQSRGLR